MCGSVTVLGSNSNEIPEENSSKAHPPPTATVERDLRELSIVFPLECNDSSSNAEALTLVRTVIGWPKLPENPKDWEKADQSTLDADLDSRMQGYFHELGGNAYATFNTMTDLAARPPQSPRFRLDRPTLERRSGA